VMKQLLLGVVLMGASAAFAGEDAFRVSFDLAADGKPLASAAVNVEDGVQSTVDVAGFGFVDVTVSTVREEPQHTLRMQFRIVQVKDGKHTVLAEPGSAMSVEPGDSIRSSWQLQLDEQQSAIKELKLAAIAQPQ
jgi:hypothetical protein